MPNTAFRNVYVPCSADRDGGLTPVIDYILSWVAGADTHVTFQLLGQTFDPPYSLAPGFVASLAGPANAEEKKRLDRSQLALAGRLQKTDVRHEVHAAQLTHEATMALAAHHARLHDISVMDDPQAYLSWGRALAEELLFHSGRPVIVVPPSARTFRAERILVAWDGTAKAARALNDAMPLLRAAKHVELVSVSGEKDISTLPPGTEAAVHLARHGISAEVVGLDAAGADPGAVMRERADLAAIDMIVMGAFAHSRWRQLVFGGVTDSMLRHTRTPIFFSA